MTDKRMRWDCIYDRIKDIPNPVGAEIGVHRGECSVKLLEMHPGLSLILVDAWSHETYKGHESGATKEFREMYENDCNKNYDIVYQNTIPFCDRTEFLTMFSIKAAKHVSDNFFDFVFIDAAHDFESVKADIEAWLPKVKKGGWMMFHDYNNPNFPGVEKSVNDKFHKSFIDIDSDYFAAVQL